MFILSSLTQNPSAYVKVYAKQCTEWQDEEKAYCSDDVNFMPRFSHLNTAYFYFTSRRKIWHRCTLT